LEVGQALVHFTEMAGMAGLQPLPLPLAAVAVLQVLVALLMVAVEAVVAVLDLPEAFLGLTLAAAAEEQCPLEE
jgi:hypothetical protein